MTGAGIYLLLHRGSFLREQTEPFRPLCEEEEEEEGGGEGGVLRKAASVLLSQTLIQTFQRSSEGLGDLTAACIT